MPPQLSEDEIDDLLYFARTGDLPDFKALSEELCTRENATLNALLSSAIDAYSGNGPLHMAAANGHTTILNHIITSLSLTSPLTQPYSHPHPHPAPTLQLPSTTALLNAQNHAGNTPLHWAALNGHLPCVKLLLDNGADPTRVNAVGHDAVYEAELGERTEVVEWVLREGGEGLESGVGGEEEEEGEEGKGDVGVGERVEQGGVDAGGEIRYGGEESRSRGGGGDVGMVGSGSGTEEGIRDGMSVLSVKDEMDHL